MKCHILIHSGTEANLKKADIFANTFVKSLTYKIMQSVKTWRTWQPEHLVHTACQHACTVIVIAWCGCIRTVHHGPRYQGSMPKKILKIMSTLSFSRDSDCQLFNHLSDYSINVTHFNFQAFGLLILFFSIRSFQTWAHYGVYVQVILCILGCSPKENVLYFWQAIKGSGGIKALNPLP